MASEEFTRKMSLYNLKKHLNALENIDFVAEADDTFPAAAAYVTSMLTYHKDYVEKASLPQRSSPAEIDRWACQMIDSFELGSMFYLNLQDFLGWHKVKIQGDTPQWFLPLARSTYFGFGFISVDYQRLHILSSEEHKFTASTESLQDPEVS
jgi:hypothetical protein